MAAVGDHQGGPAVTRTCPHSETRTIDRQRAALARAAASASSGLSGPAGLRPRPRIRTRVPTGSSLGSAATITLARPAAGRQRLPVRTAVTATTQPLDGPTAAARRSSPAGGSSFRGDSTTVPRIARGTGAGPSCQAMSSPSKSSSRVLDQAAPARSTAPTRTRAAGRG